MEMEGSPSFSESSRDLQTKLGSSALFALVDGVGTRKAGLRGDNEAYPIRRLFVFGERALVPGVSK